MKIRIRDGVTRRRLLATGASATAFSAIGSLAKPYLSHAADRPLLTHGVQSGDVSSDSGVIWARADRPARMLVEVATTDSFRNIRHGVFVDALPESDLTAKALIEDLPAGQDIFYRVHFQDLSSPTDRRRAGGRPLSHCACRSPLDLFRLVGRHRRTRLGHRRSARRPAHLCHHAAEPAGLLHPQWRHDLRRRADFGRAEAAGRRHVEEHRYRGEIEVRGNARRIPRQLQIQPSRQEHPRLQRGSSYFRAMGRSRGHQQLVAGRGLDPCRASAQEIHRRRTR